MTKLTVFYKLHTDNPKDREKLMLCCSVHWSSHKKI